MSRSSVLGAAAALHQFTAAQIAAYCEEDEDGVGTILHEHRDLFEPVASGPAPCWRVVDRKRLREVIATAERGERPAGAARRPGPRGSREARLLLAEQTLIDCAGESSAASRQTMAATAKNYLRQFVADQPGAAAGRAWWEIDGLGDAPAPDGPVSPARLRTDFALAALTVSEAASQQVSIGFLIDTAGELSRLMRSREAGQERVRRLFRRFTELARNLTTPFGPEQPGAAPAKLLSALAWRRAGPAAQGGWERAAQAQLTLLRTMADHQPLALGCLYRVLGEARAGRQRVVVYQDLIDLLPNGSDCDPVEAILPGALVAADAGTDAGRLLSGFAEVIEGDLVTSPYRSERALVGQVAYRFDEFADAQAGRDDSVTDRTNRTRRNLLELFDVDV